MLKPQTYQSGAKTRTPAKAGVIDCKIVLRVCLVTVGWAKRIILPTRSLRQLRRKKPLPHLIQAQLCQYGSKAFGGFAAGQVFILGDN